MHIKVGVRGVDASFFDKLEFSRLNPFAFLGTNFEDSFTPLPNPHERARGFYVELAAIPD
jgi:hypothetical protein